MSSCLLQNILDKFNPGAKQLIASSKSYLKNLQSTSVASKVFIESLAKLAVNAHEGGTTDIGKHSNTLRVFEMLWIFHFSSFLVWKIWKYQNSLSRFSKCCPTGFLSYLHFIWWINLVFINENQEMFMFMCHIRNHFLFHLYSLRHCTHGSCWYI